MLQFNWYEPMTSVGAPVLSETKVNSMKGTLGELSYICHFLYSWCCKRSTPKTNVPVFVFCWEVQRQTLLRYDDRFTVENYY